MIHENDISRTPRRLFDEFALLNEAIFAVRRNIVDYNTSKHVTFAERFKPENYFVAYHVRLAERLEEWQAAIVRETQEMFLPTDD